MIIIKIVRIIQTTKTAVVQHSSFSVVEKCKRYAKETEIEDWKRKKFWRARGASILLVRGKI